MCQTIHSTDKLSSSPKTFALLLFNVIFNIFSISKLNSVWIFAAQVEDFSSKKILLPHKGFLEYWPPGFHLILIQSFHLILIQSFMDIIAWQKDKNTDKTPSTFINVDMQLVFFSSAYGHFCYNIDKGGEGVFKVASLT